jgi:hypothetical protein
MVLPAKRKLEWLNLQKVNLMGVDEVADEVISRLALA